MKFDAFNAETIGLPSTMHCIMARYGRKPCDSGPFSSPESRGSTCTARAAEPAALDIRTLDRHSLASVGSLVLGL
jgi:hypothetical protein